MQANEKIKKSYRISTVTILYLSDNPQIKRPNLVKYYTDKKHRCENGQIQRI